MDMLSDCMRYVFVDPFGVSTSGVTAYVRIASQRLKQKGIDVRIIARTKNERLYEFKKRVSSDIKKWSDPAGRLIVEAPESLAATSLISTDVQIHIRLHCSRSLGALLQGKKYDVRDVEAEQNEINRAAYVSAPSQAAIEAGKLLFSFSQPVVIYPNPIQIELGETNEKISKIDVLFIGRCHDFKGVSYVIEAAKQLPAVSFCLACPDPRLWPTSLPKNVLLLDGVNANKSALLQAARVVLLPSKFETASMVGLESIAMGTPVITWEHIPLNEYFTHPWVYSAPFDDINSIVVLINHLVRSEKPKAESNILDVLNSDFEVGAFGILTDRLCTIAHLKPLREKIRNVIFELPNRKGLIMPKDNSSWQRIRRKLRKLRRNPVGFFMDSKGLDGTVFRYFYRLVHKRNSEQPICDYSNKQTPINKVDLLEVLPVESSFPEHVAASLRLGEISRYEKIQIKDPVGKAKGWRTVLVYPKGYVYLVSDLTSCIEQFSDFSPLKSDALMHIATDVDELEPPVSILNRIDLRNKERISELDNIVMFDTHVNLIEAIRSSGTNQKIILVLTKDIGIDFECSANYIDALICIGDIDLKGGECRRTNVIASLSQLPVMLRKVVQEIGPKDPNMLIPLIGGEKYVPELFEFDSRRYQGIIRLNSRVDLQCNDFKAYVSELAERVEQLFVIESIYMRNRSLCEAIENGDSPKKLIELCLYDGVIFDVN